MMGPWTLISTPNGDLRFAQPAFLVLLLLVPVLYLLIRQQWQRRPMTFSFPAAAEVRAALGTGARKLRRPVHVLRVLGLAAAIVALARPQFGRVERQTFSEGIDIMLVLDVSLSMRTTDFIPDRLEAAKSVLQEFVSGRVGDRLGLVIFGSSAATIVPLTLDYGVVQSFIEKIRFNLLGGESTAIGMGLATALSKLEDSKAKSKIIILLTDGENNAGNIDPLVAAEAAKTSKVRVYTIGVGSDARRWSVFGPVSEAGIDEQTLSRIAEMTGGLYFRATDNSKLSGIYKEIDQLERSRVESIQFDNFNELFPLAVVLALALLALEFGVGYTRLVEVP